VQFGHIQCSPMNEQLAYTADALRAFNFTRSDKMLGNRFEVTCQDYSNICSLSQNGRVKDIKINVTAQRCRAVFHVRLT